MKTITIDMLVGKLIAFELSKFGDSFPQEKTILKSIVSRKGKGRHNPNEGTSKYVSIYDEELRKFENEEREPKELEALFVKILGKGKGKYEGKPPSYFFVFNKLLLSLVL
jgi:hypothetical protein